MRGSSCAVLVFSVCLLAVVFATSTPIQTITFPGTFSYMGVTISAEDLQAVITARDKTNRPAGLFFERRTTTSPWQLVNNITYVYYVPSFAYYMDLLGGRAALESLIVDHDDSKDVWNPEVVVAPEFSVAPQIRFLDEKRVAISSFDKDYCAVLSQDAQDQPWKVEYNISAPHRLIRPGMTYEASRNLLFIPSYPDQFMRGNHSVLIVDTTARSAGAIVGTITDFGTDYLINVHDNSAMSASGDYLAVPVIEFDTNVHGVRLYVRASGSAADDDTTVTYKFVSQLQGTNHSDIVGDVSLLVSAKQTLITQRVIGGTCQTQVELYRLSDLTKPYRVITPPSPQCVFGQALAVTSDLQQLLVSDPYSSPWGSVFVYEMQW